MMGSDAILVIDASIIIAWLFVDESSEVADAVARRMQNSAALVPVHFTFEVANVLLQSVKKGRIEADEVTEYWQIIRALPIVVDSQPSWGMLQTVYDLATTHRLTVYDAAYLELALRRELSIASLDTDLCKAATKLGVPLLGAE